MNKLGLYLHFPFCKGKCAYCDFYSLPDLSLKEDYEKALCRFVSHYGKKASSYEVDTVYFGGGTPSLLSSDGLNEIMKCVRDSFSLLSSAEITLEMNPESCSTELLAAAKNAGVNRISLGMQSALDTELSLLGRLHDAKKTKEAVGKIREIGFENLSLDLMYGLPSQTLSDFEKSLRECVSLSPEHVSFYCLTLSPEVPLYKKSSLIPRDEDLREMYRSAVGFLEEKGYEQYEISNASKKGFRSRHNERYWLGSEYLGIGPGAHSFFGGERFSVKEDLKEFILASNPEDMIENRERMTDEDERIEYVMLSLRRKEGIDLEKLRTIFSQEAFLSAEKKFSLWEKVGLCRRTVKGFALTTDGFFVSNEIISELI